MNLYRIHKTHFWQWAWWREDGRRIKAAAACAAVLLLLAVSVSRPDGSAAPAKETAETLPAVTVLPRDPSAAGDTQAVRQPEPENGLLAAGEQESQAAAYPEAERTAAVMAEPAMWFLPGDGEFDRGFGYDYDPTHGDFRFHPGCDMQLPIGSLVYAAADGVVLSVANDDLWGGVVTVDHGHGWTTVYKCLTPRVQAGEPVSVGESIGSVIDSPLAEAAQVSHLHFEVYLNEEEVDPLPLYNR
ncbi:MAG: M23 family metallopeptidase [Firmicutes bacterium]|nr:M23 family metallopeptidase [Bacillota bacterium]